MPAFTLLSADGSQIVPNPHNAVFYGLINVGVFRFCTINGNIPETHTWSDLIYEEPDSDPQETLTEDLISLRRDVFEREILASLAQNETSPLITLTDGPLELYHEPREDRNFERYFNQYLKALDDLALLNTITAGYVDRPRAALLVNLLELMSPPGANRPYAGVTDLMLMEKILQPGERSAVFALQFRYAKQYSGRKALHFFYLNVGSLRQSSIARVEIPLWVAENKNSLNLLHAALLQQASQSGTHPYPYALIRAHETAVVKMDEHEALDRLIQNELLSRGFPLAEASQKLINKMVGKRTRY